MPPPPNAADLRSIRTWQEGHAAPVIAIEVVSETNPHKDYTVAPEKYAASGTGEPWVFDPLLAGPTAHGGPFRLQVWRRQPNGDFARVYAGDGPAESPTLGARLVVTDEGRKLRIAVDQEATQFWRTPEEAERSAKEAALARIAELEAELAKRGASK